jgi:hypothetical protein
MGRNYSLTRHTLGLAHKWRSKAGQRCRSVRNIYVRWLLLWPRVVEQGRSAGPHETDNTRSDNRASRTSCRADAVSSLRSAIFQPSLTLTV